MTNLVFAYRNVDSMCCNISLSPMPVAFTDIHRAQLVQDIPNKYCIMTKLQLIGYNCPIYILTAPTQVLPKKFWEERDKAYDGMYSTSSFLSDIEIYIRRAHDSHHNSN